MYWADSTGRRNTLDYILFEQLGLEVVPYWPPKDPSTEGVEDHRFHIQEACPGRHIVDGSAPKHVEFTGIKVPVDQIAGRPQLFVADSGSRSAAATDTLQACGFHQPFDPLATDWNADLYQFNMDTRSSISFFQSGSARSAGSDRHRP